MTPAEASDLAKRIINTWHGGPSVTEWTEALTALDHGTAGTTFVRLRNELEHAPSIAAFVKRHRSLATVTNRPIAPSRHTTPRSRGTEVWIDAMGWDRDTPIDRDHPRAQAAFAAGYAQGLADIDAIKRGEPDPMKDDR